MRTPRVRTIAAFFLLLFAFQAPSLFAYSDFYWESPAPFSAGVARYPVSAFNADVSAVAWQESERIEGDGMRIGLSVAVKRGGEPWRIRRNVAGPYVFSGGEPSISSIAVDKKGRIVLAVSASALTMDVLISSDFGASFEKSTVSVGQSGTSSSGAVAPRIFVRADGGFLLFATRGADQTLSLFVARSDDGKVWSSFLPFISEEGLRLNFLPTHASAGGMDFVVFQSLSATARPTFQLYMKSSQDGGATWGAAGRITSFRDPFAQTTDPELFDNQRAHIAAVGPSLYLTWERRIGSQSPQVYIAELKENGDVNGEADRVTNAGAYCNNPLVFEYNKEPAVVWFDNRRGQNRVYLAQRSGVLWQDQDLSGARLDAAFARPAVGSDGLYVFWQSNFRGSDRLMFLEPDKKVAPPALAADNFVPSKRIRRDTARISWTAPADSSGIAGYSFSWSMDPNEVPPKNQTAFASATSAERVATEDGAWYFSVSALDFAGNWSAPARIEFVRDTTPPGRVNVVLPPVDDRGYLASNSFTIEWNPPPASDLAGYAWELEYVAPPDYLKRYATLAAFDFEAQALRAFPRAAPLRQFVGPQPFASFENRDDGLWRFSVAVVDEVGNIGEPVSRYFRTNKYIPYTYITFADAVRDDFGTLTLNMVGRGFSEGGRIERIFLDQDGKPPYDREFTLSAAQYRVESDRTITGLRVDDLAEGRYRIGLVHPARGLYLTSPIISVDETGTVKFGDYSRTWEPSWTKAAARRFVIDSALMLLAAIVVFGLFGAFASVRGIGSVLKESAEIRTEVAALLTGELMPSEKKAFAASVRKRSGGLSFKLVLFTTTLVVLVVVLVSVPLSILMTRTQEETLVRGLKDRSRVLLESLASGARAYLPSQNVLELGFLPAQTAAIPEAHYATITGFGSNATTFRDHIWATNDPDIAKKIDTSEFRAGISRLEDPLSPKIQAITKELDDQARAEVGSISSAIADLTQEGLKLALRTDAESLRRRDDIQATARELEARLAEKLAAVASRIGSEPAFDGDRLPLGVNTFIFFKPVMFRQGAEDIYLRGLVRLEVGTESITASIAAGRQELIRTTVTVALLAVIIGVIGALLLAKIIVGPLKRLVSHVEKIRDTDDKAALEGHDIIVKSRDEIAVLGDTINDMTHGLVKAAAASKDLTVGKEVQKMFIPLETDDRGRKLISGRLETEDAEFFGYYEGAKGVSGDYFNYMKLDDSYFAVIKCDVSGKGVPAALIMVEVATLFQDHFQGWKRNAAGLNLEPLVYRINGFINSQGYKGLFAAFTLCLFDSKTGLVRFCNAGDKLVHYYDASERKLKTLTLAETPAAGPFPNDLVEMKTGFPMQSLKLDSGDFLLLYTDGIEEAKRLFRDSQLRELVYWKSDDTFSLASEGKARAKTETRPQEEGIGDEDIGFERAEAIVEAVLSQKRYELTKIRNPDPQERFTFDFTRCAGTIEEAITALVSVEKVFRMYRDPKAGENDRVLVDRKVDAFLRDHFDQYRAYAGRTKDHPEFREYVYYTHVREDAQYDDLTLLSIKKK